jgi:hypothetical protein
MTSDMVHVIASMVHVTSLILGSANPIARRLARRLEQEESHIAALASSPGQPAPTGVVQELDAAVG